jgi:hypothetical protein
MKFLHQHFDKATGALTREQVLDQPFPVLDPDVETVKVTVITDRSKPCDGREASGRTNAADDCIAKIGELAELAASLLADARSLRDRVAELQDDGMEIPALVDAADRLHAAAGAAARELAAVDNDFDDWLALSQTRGAR